MDGDGGLRRHEQVEPVRAVLSVVLPRPRYSLHGDLGPKTPISIILAISIILVISIILIISLIIFHNINNINIINNIKNINKINIAGRRRGDSATFPEDASLTAWIQDFTMG